MNPTSDAAVLAAAAFAGLCVLFATLVIVEFFGYASLRYKEKFSQQAAVEFDDILLQMPPSRVFDLSVAIAAVAIFLVGGSVSLFTSNPSWYKILFVSLLAGAIAFPIPRMYFRHLKTERLRKFNEQLEDALLSMSSALKAGFSITQALENVANENRRPISFEFTLLIQELRLGVQFDLALKKMADRVQSADFELVAVAILTARQTGGELTGILERLAGVIRERIRITQRIRALTAQGRMQAVLIAAIPFLLMFIMAYIAPDIMSAFFSSPVGILIMLGVIVLVATGFLIIRKITNIDI